MDSAGTMLLLNGEGGEMIGYNMSHRLEARWSTIHFTLYNGQSTRLARIEIWLTLRCGAGNFC